MPRPRPKDAPIYQYILEQRREKGESIVYKVVRGGQAVLWFEPKHRLYDIAREVIHYLNRDRREIVFVEDRMLHAERRLEEVARLCSLLVVNLEWCRENVDHPANAKQVDVWVVKARKLLKEIMGDAWK